MTQIFEKRHFLWQKNAESTEIFKNAKFTKLNFKNWPHAKKARPLIRPQKCLYHKRMAPLFNWMGPQRNYINWKRSPLSLFRSFPPRKKRGAWAIRRCLLLYKLISSCIKICCIRLYHKIKYITSFNMYTLIEISAIIYWSHSNWKCRELCILNKA